MGGWQGLRRALKKGGAATAKFATDPTLAEQSFLKKLAPRSSRPTVCTSANVTAVAVAVAVTGTTLVQGGVFSLKNANRKIYRELVPAIPC